MMQAPDSEVIPRLLAAALAAAVLACAAIPGAVAAEEDSDAAATTSGDGADKAVVVPYESRPAPAYRVSLNDGRVFFLHRLEETDEGFVLHTTEDERIEVERSAVTEIVELKKTD